MKEIILENIVKRFEKVEAIDHLSCEIKRGEFVTLLGPSGCGKTTTLRAIAGLEEPDEGEIYIKDRCVFSSRKGLFIPPGKRGLGLVFQSYALWPHMNVYQNISFGLEELHYKREDIIKKVREVLAKLKMNGFEDRYPSELSGGQQQRVALARMIAPEPGILLMDEPLSNLDAKLRMNLRAEIKRLHKDTGATTIYVTHDQIEAITLSDRIIVLKEGILQQSDTPYNLYHYPANLFIADFMGNPHANLVSGLIEKENGNYYFRAKEGEFRILLNNEIKNLEDIRDIVVSIRPEDIDIHTKDKKEADYLEMIIYSILPAGSETIIYARRGESVVLVIKTPEEEAADLAIDQHIYASFKTLNLYDKKTENLIFSKESNF